MQLRQIDVTGSRLIGAITKELGLDGPKHHAVILGQGVADGEVYVAELMQHGYQIASYQDFCGRYAANGPIQLDPNTGHKTNAQVAKQALMEVRHGQVRYDLLVNNCECFVNRSMHDRSSSSQVINTALGLVALAGLYYVVKKSA